MWSMNQRNGQVLITSKLSSFQRSQNSKQLRSLVSAAAPYKKVVEWSRLIVASLFILTHENQPFVWSDESQATYKLVAELPSIAHILAHFDNTKNLVLQIDANFDGTGHALSNVSTEGSLKVLLMPIEQFSKRKTSTLVLCRSAEKFQLRFGPSEILSLFGFQIFFQVFPDHNVHCGLFKMENHKERWARWVLCLTNRMDGVPARAISHCVNMNHKF